MTTASAPSPGDVVLIRVDFLDGSGAKIRPAVVVSSFDYNGSWRQFVYVPVTGSVGPVGGAIEIEDLAPAGLNRRSFCHGTMLSAEVDNVVRRLGSLSARDRAGLRNLLARIVAI